MSSTDKKYELYKALQSTKWDELPNTYGEFQRKLNDKDFFNKSHSILTSSYPDLEESKLSRDEFYNFVNSNNEYQSNIKYYSDEEPAYEEYKPFLQRSAETVGDIVKTGFNLFPAVQLFNLITGNYDDTIEAGKNIARIPLGAWKLARGIPGALENWAIELAPGAYGSQSLELDPYATSEERIKHTEKVMELQKELDDPESSYNKTILNNIKEYADLRKRMKDQWIEAGVINKEETPAGQFFESFGFTAGILATAFVPGVGTPLAFGLGMSGEGMELAADVYEGTNGNLEATKKAFNIGTLLGTTEALTPLDAAIFAKKGITNLIKKDIMNGFKKEALKGFGLAGARQIGREFVGEGLQEGFQTWGEQLTKIDAGMQTKINWDEVFDATFLGGLTGALMGGAAVGYNTVKEADNLRAYVNTELPKKLDEYVKYGLITPAERDRELLRFYNATSVQDIKQTIMSGTPIEANQDFKDKLRTIIKTQNLYKELKKAFDTPIDENHISKAMAIKDKALKDGVLLNDFDMFLLSHIESSGAKISEFDDPAIMHNYTTMLLNGIIQRTKEFDEVKGIIAQETGKTGEELTSLTHQTILNTDRFAKYREGYLNSLVAFTPHLEAIESTYKTDSFELSHNDLAEKEAVLHMKYFEMNNRQLEAFIRNRDNKLLYIKRKDSYRYSQAVAEFNRRMVKENEPKRYRYEFVRQGGRLVYKVIPFEKKVDDNGQIEMFQKGLSFDLKGTNVMPFNNPKAFEVTSAFDKWLSGLGNKLDISKPFNIKEVGNFGKQLIEQFREEYLAKNNFTSIPKERIADFKKDWNDWLKNKFGLKHKEGSYGNEGLYGLDNIIREAELEPNKIVKATGNIQGSEVIISGDFLLKDMPHEYTIGNQEGAGLGWYIYSEVNGEPFIYEWQSDILPDLFGKSVSSTRKLTGYELYKDLDSKIPGDVIAKNRTGDAYLYFDVFKGQEPITKEQYDEYVKAGKKDISEELNQTIEIETLTSGEVRITDKDGTKYYTNNPNPNYTFNLNGFQYFYWRGTQEIAFKAPAGEMTKEEISIEELNKAWIEARNVKEITKQEFEAKKEELSKQSAEEGLKDFTGDKKDIGYIYQDYQDGAFTNEEFNEMIKSFDSPNQSVISVLENLYKRYWNIWLMHSFIYAKERGHSTVWLPTGEAMYHIEGNRRTAGMYITALDKKRAWSVDEIGVSKETALYKILKRTINVRQNKEGKFQRYDNNTNEFIGKEYDSVNDLYDAYVGPYWTALNKIKGIKLELSQPEWSTVPLIKADISGVATEAVTLFQKGGTIYSQLGNKTKSENVVIKPWGELKDAKEAIVAKEPKIGDVVNIEFYFEKGDKYVGVKARIKEIEKYYQGGSITKDNQGNIIKEEKGTPEYFVTLEKLDGSRTYEFSVGEDGYITQTLGKNNKSFIGSDNYIKEFDLTKKDIQIISTRIRNSNEHFGNPFSHDPAGKTQGLIKTETIKEAVEKYIDWVINSKNNFYTGKIKPEPNTIFVFGSNPEGRHGAGAAKIAKEQFGAIYGQGEGLQGNAYALPTKDLRVKENNGFKSISSEQIVQNIKKLYKVAKENPNKQFKIGYTNTTEKSLNGYTGIEMIEMFNQAGEVPNNIVFSEEWNNTGKLLNSRAEWIREQLKSGELKGKPILYYKELGEPSHATALDYLVNKYSWSSKSQVPIISYTNNSGGATGSDTEWENIGAEFGVKTNAFSFEGHNTGSKNKVILTNEQLKEGGQAVLKANKTLNRAIDGLSPYVKRLLARNWFQVKNSDAVFAIGKLIGDKVDGGTGWAVQMAIDNNKTVHLFDQNTNKWYQFNNGKWEVTDTPVLTKNFAGIGTRQITDAGRQAIRDVYEKTFSQKKVSPALPNAGIQPIMAKNEIDRLTAMGEVDLSIQPIVDWLSNMFGDIQIVYDETQQTPGAFKYNPKTNQKIIIVNPKHQSIKNNADLYRTIAHELIHNATYQLLKSDMIFRKQLGDLYSEIKKQIVGTTFYEENKDDLDRIFNDGQHELDEFLAYVISNTSALRGWMATTEFKPGTTWLKRFYGNIMAALMRLFGKAPKLSYLQALETLMNQTMFMPTTTIEPLGIPFYPQLTQERVEAADIIDKALSLNDEALGDVRSMTSFIDALDLDLDQSPYEYIQSISKEDFYTIVNRSKNLDAKMRIYYDKNFKQDMTFDEYKQAVSTYVYNNINSVRKRKTAVVTIDSTGVPTVKYYTETYKSSDGSLISPYHSLTMLDEIIPQLNTLFNTRFEVVYLEEVKDNSGWKPLVNKPHKLYFELNNSELQDIYSKVGVIFPGTFADKDTVIGLIEVDGQGNPIEEKDYSDPETTDIKQITDALLEMYRGRMQSLVESGKVTAEYMQEIDSPTVASITRLVMEDLKLGGKIVNGQLFSALFDPNYSDTYDAIKIFKRPYLVSPKYIAAQLPKEVSAIVNMVVRDTYNNDQDQSGIVVRNGKVYFRSIIFDDDLRDEQGNLVDHIVNIDGVDYNLTKMLINDYGTSTVDGGFLYGLGGFDVVYRYLTGAVKQGAIKLWGGNNYEGEFSAPFFLKTAGHGYSQEDNIIQWARANNISLIIPKSAVKVNRYKINGLLETSDGVFEIPMDNLYRLQEKDEVSELARGMQQTLTTNFMTYANNAFAKADDKKEFWNLAKQFADNLIGRFMSHTVSIDKQGLLGYIKGVIEKPTNEYSKGLSQVLSNMLITYADERVKELSDEDKENKDIVKELLRDQRLSNVMLAEKISGLFYHPYFSKIFEDYMHKLLKELLFYDIPGSYSVLTPDIGWLAQTRIKEASDFALSLVKDNLTKEVKKLNESFKVLDEERSSIAGALESAVKEGKEELAIELNKRKDEILKEMDAIAEQIDEKESQIANGNRKEVQEARDKILYGWIDKESGRIKGDYIYYSESSAKEKNIKIGDTVITGFIPSDSAQSISGATVIGLLGKKLSEVNKIVGWSEYFQSQSGKYFDFDTALVMAYDEIFGSLTDFLKLAEIFRDTKNNYPAYIKGIMEKVLGRKLSDKDIYNKEIRLKYMQLLSSVAKSPAVHNPLFNQSILNKYKKQIGVPVNKRKMATFKSLVGFKTKFVLYDNVFNIDGNRKNIDKTHMFHLIETNAAVDLPSDDTALKYALDAVREFDIENGTDLTSLITDAKSEVDLSVKSLMLPKYASMFKQIDQFLFGYGVKLSTKNNLDDFDEARTLQDSVKYIRMQNRINERLKTPEGKQALFDYFSKHVFKVKASADAKARMLKVAKMYIDNITIENMENSISMYIADRVDLTTLPNIKLEAGEYLAVEEKVAEELMEKYADVKKKNLGVLSEFKKLLDDVHEASKSFPDNKNARLNKILFLLTRDNEKLHILKGKILRVVNMFVQPEGLLVPQYNLTRFSKDLSVKADEEIFLDMFNAVLAKKRIVKPGTPYVSTTLNVKGKAMTVSFKNGKLLFEITGSNGQKISVYHDQIESLVKSGDPVGKAFQRYFSEAFGVREGKNRAAIAQMVDFSNTLDLIDRWKIAEDVIIPEIESLSDTEKRILFTSLLSYSPTVNESLYVGKEERSNDRHLTLLSLLRNDPVAVKFIEDYAVAFTQFVPHPDFTKAMDSVRTVRETDTDWEVWNMQSPGKKNLQKNLEDLRQEETNKPYVDPAIAVGKIVDLQNGNIIDLTLGDIGRIVEPYIPKVTTAKSDIDVISAAMKKHLEAVNKIDSFYKQTDIEITRMENLYLSRGNEKIKSFTKPQELNKLREEIEDLVTSNPDGITIAKNANGNYIYTYNSVQYSNLNDLLNVLGITDIREKTKYEIAMKWHILYSVENPIFIKSMVSYLQSVVFEFGRNSYAIQMVVSMQKRYEEFLNNISKRQFHYYPRVYRQHIFETKIMNYLKVQEAVRIQAEIDDALTYIADVQAYNSRPANKNSQRIIPNAITSLASHNGDSAWILGKAKDNVEKEKFNIGVGSFGKYINAFSLKRDLPDLIDGVKYYIRDSMLSHHRHQAQFIKMLKNDLLFVNWLSFQHKALLNNMDIKTIEAVKTEVATIGGNRMLLSRDLSAAEALPGMEISFFYINDRYYSGVVDRIDNQYIYLKTDKQKYERYIKEQIKKYERVDTLIQSNPHLTAPTYAQLAVLQDLANQGYITVQEILAIQNAYEASTRIVNILKDILDDNANWGRFKKRDMFRKNASARGAATGENGIYRYIEFGSIDYLKGIARELDNTFDGQLSEGGFGEIIKSGNLLPYLKYEMLKLPANIIDTGSKAIALMGLSTPAAAVKNIFDGIAGVIRDRGFRETAKIAFKVKSIGSEVKEKFKAGEVAYNQAILDTLINAGEVQFKEDKVKVAVEISKQFMLEQGLIFEDYLINSVAGNIEELFIEDEKNQTGYKTSEKLFNLYKTFKDSIGYKEHRDKIIELEKKLYDSIDPVESQRLMREIQFENVRWETVYNARMTELRNLVQKYTIKPVPIDLMKVNLAEMHNKTTGEIMLVLAKALPKSNAIQWMIGTKGFKRAEGHIRRMTAINYIYNAVLRGETDVDLIKLEAAKGIARTQALYDVMSRRLGDRTKLGRFALMFGQYPYYMKQIAKGTIKQAKEEGRNDLKVKLAKEWYRDTVMSGFSFFFQGLRLGSPINMTINGVLILLLQALKRMDDDKEPFDFADWDTKEVMFNLLQFKIGMGIGLALGTAYNAVTDQNSLISVGRIGKAYEVFYKTISDIFGLSEDVPKWQDKYATENWIRLVSRYTFGINPLFPSYSPDYTDEDLIEHYKTPIGQRWMDYWEPLIPLYPHVKYKTDF